MDSGDLSTGMVRDILPPASSIAPTGGKPPRQDPESSRRRRAPAEESGDDHLPDKNEVPHELDDLL